MNARADRRTRVSRRLDFTPARLTAERAFFFSSFFFFSFPLSRGGSRERSGVPVSPRENFPPLSRLLRGKGAAETSGSERLESARDGCGLAMNPEEKEGGVDRSSQFQGTKGTATAS